MADFKDSVQIKHPYTAYENLIFILRSKKNVISWVNFYLISLDRSIIFLLDISQSYSCHLDFPDHILVHMIVNGVHSTSSHYLNSVPSGQPGCPLLHWSSFPLSPLHARNWCLMYTILFNSFRGKVIAVSISESRKPDLRVVFLSMPCLAEVLAQYIH